MGHRFESCYSRHCICGNSSVVERHLAKVKVASSNLVSRSIIKYGCIAQLGEHLPYKQGVTGSSPVSPTIRGLVVQLVRMPACHAGGRGFESLPGRQFNTLCWCGSTVEQLTCNQQVVGSTPITSSNYTEDFPSGQRGQTVNLLALLSVVRIHHPPPTIYKVKCGCGGIGRRTRLRI